MDYKDFTQRVLAGEFKNGDTFWVTDYRHNDINNKAIRHQVPIQVVLECEDVPSTLYWNRTILAAYFRPILRNGKLGSKKISPLDNTSRSQDGLFVFLDQEGALEKYKDQCDDVEKAINKGRKDAATYFDRLEDELNKKREAQGI